MEKESPDGVLFDMDSWLFSGCARRLSQNTRMHRHAHTPCTDTADRVERWMGGQTQRHTNRGTETQRRRDAATETERQRQTDRRTDGQIINETLWECLLARSPIPFLCAWGVVRGLFTHPLESQELLTKAITADSPLASLIILQRGWIPQPQSAARIRKTSRPGGVHTLAVLRGCNLSVCPHCLSTPLSFCTVWEGTLQAEVRAPTELQLGDTTGLYGRALGDTTR